MVRINAAQVRKKLDIYISVMEQRPLLASFLGHMFESHAIRCLEIGGTFRCKKLEHGNKKDRPVPTTVTIPVRDLLSEGGAVADQLYVPATKNFTAIDAWMPNFGLFQMTVSNSHSIKVDEMKAELENQNDLPNFYWLLPPEIFGHFTKRTTVMDIDQYAILIPHPEPNTE
jgi:hypothetical protein